MARRKSRAVDQADHTVFVLQGGGALGAYQAGAFEALAKHARHPDWVAGISIGAINAALIAGNPPEKRVERLRSFWERITSAIPSSLWTSTDDQFRSWVNNWSAAWAASFGLPGFFRPRMGATAWSSGADPSLPSIYDTEPLRESLVELVDFDLVNDGPTRLSVGAVEVHSGNFRFFDSRDTRIGPEHVMASGALPPGFPAVEIEGKQYWDGGIVSNTPLRHVVENLDDGAATIFQVDLFSARGELPRTLAEVAEREKDIQFSSRTRAITDMLRERNESHRRLRALAAMLPATRRASREVQDLLAGTNDAAITLVHLIHRHKGYDTQTKDYEFSRDSMREHWNVGLSDMSHSLRELSAATPSAESESFRVFDYNPRTHKGGSR